MASRVLLSRLSSRISPLVHPSKLYLQALTPNPSPNPSPLSFLRQNPPFVLRHFSSVPRRQPARPRPVDIGARARQLQTRRLWTYALTFSCVAGFIVIVLANFQDQLVFYITPTDVLQKYRENPSKTKFRLGGLVLEGSVIHPNASSPEMEFVVTDLITDILVRYEGSLPDLFREGHSVVVEGFVRKFDGEAGVGKGGPKVSEKAKTGEFFFKATEVLAKHDEKYMPAEVAAAIEKNKKTLEAEAEASVGAVQS